MDDDPGQDNLRQEIEIQRLANFVEGRRPILQLHAIGGEKVRIESRIKVLSDALQEFPEDPRRDKWKAELVNLSAELVAINALLPQPIPPINTIKEGATEAPAPVTVQGVVAHARPATKAGKRLRKLKDESRLTWDGIAEGSGISKRQLQAIANEGANPGSQTKKDLSDFFRGRLKRLVRL